MTEYREMYDQLMSDLRSKGFGGYVDSLNDYKSTTPIQPWINPEKTKTVNTTLSSEKKNGGPAAGIGGPFLPIAKVVS
jgi:hypothetical protein